MNVSQLQKTLTAHPDSSLSFQLPSGEFVPAHFHVTEVGRVRKSFIDCGGTRREAESCLLQVWTANDLEHRLLAGRLAKILALAEPILESLELPVEVEYGVEVAAQYSVLDIHIATDGLTLLLAGKQTACLAEDRCGVGDSGCCDEGQLHDLSM